MQRDFMQNGASIAVRSFIWAPSVQTKKYDLHIQGMYQGIRNYIGFLYNIPPTNYTYTFRYVKVPTHTHTHTHMFVTHGLQSMHQTNVHDT